MRGMRRGRVVVLAVAILLTVWSRAEAQRAKTVDPLCTRVLPAESANRLTGRDDLQLVPRLSIRSAGGTCNYAAGGKTMVFLLTVLDEKSRAAEHYARYKGQPAYQAHQKEVAGIGDAAFTGGEYEHEVVVRKGSRLLLLASMLEVEKPTRTVHATVERERLVAIAREVSSKL
jgi:hypothetical protein